MKHQREGIMKDQIDEIIQEAQRLIIIYPDAFDKNAVMRGFRKRVRRILNGSNSTD